MPRELLPQALTAKVYMEVGVVHQAHLLTTRHGPDWAGEKNPFKEKKKIEPFAWAGPKANTNKGVLALWVRIWKQPCEEEVVPMHYCKL